MKHVTLGIILGSLLTTGIGMAGSFYNKEGQSKAPTGSIQQQDYFRQRQLFLDTQALRRQADNDRLRNLTDPCRR